MLFSGPIWAQDSSTLPKATNPTPEIDQLYQLALDALKANEPEQARQKLERVVAINPQFAGAWLDLAIATYRSGDPAAALEHLLYLKGQFDIPEPLAAQVESLIKQLQGSPQRAKLAKWQGELWFGLGKDSNANLGLLRDQIELSLPTGNASFNTADDYRSRTDQFTLSGLTLAGPAWQALGGAQVSPVLLLRNKSFSTETDFNVLDTQAGFIYQRSVPQSVDWQASLFVQNYQLGGRSQFNALRFGLQRSQPWGATCQASAGNAIETRNEKFQPSLGGNTFSLKLGVSCLLPGNVMLAANLGTSYEHANPNRPGGNNQNTELGLRFDKPLNAMHSFHVMWQINQGRDQSGYSPLMESNATRTLSRQAFSISLRQNVTRQWQTRLSVDGLKQHSNLALFQKQAAQLMVSLHYQID